MKIGELEEQYRLELEQLYDNDEVKALFSLSAEHVLGLSPGRLRMDKHASISFIDIQKLLSILNDLIIGKPIQHILGEAHFYGFVFKVDKNVLIPRPETEELVDWIIGENNTPANQNLRVLDIGTGSGCIPISLKKYLHHSEIYTLDVSPEAISVAKENANGLDVKINFIEGDILTFKSDLKFDIIVSNPPYVRHLEKEEMHNNVLAHEPHLALFVSNDDPLVFYKAIADFALTNLNPGGQLYIEINEYLAKETINILSDKGLKSIELKLDMQGKDRMIKAVKF